MVGFALMPGGRATAQTFKTFYSGQIVRFGFVSSGNTLYLSGRNGVSGTLCAINTNGTGFTNLHSFDGGGISNPQGTNSDGANPRFLMLSGQTLYGTTPYGGSSGNGTVFAINTNGTGFTNLHSFTLLSNPPYSGTNSDGALPVWLVSSGNTLYGTTQNGGSSGIGTVFAINTNGTGFTNLHSFNGNSDGDDPGFLLLSGKTLYGTTRFGNYSTNNGTLFAMNTDGTGFTNLYVFTGGFSTNSDGSLPNTFVLSGNTLYGAAGSGGSSGNGTVFAINTNGTGFTNLHNLNGSSDGGNPVAAFILGNVLYGGAVELISGLEDGILFSLSLGSVASPQLSIIRSSTNVILTWPTNVAGFTLQSTTNLVSLAAWITNSPAPVVVNGLNTVTNPISGTRKFYRLSQ